MTKTEQIIFIKGKNEGLKTLFNSSNFGYLAIGHADPTNNGFEAETSLEDQTESGFQEISKNEEGQYTRIPLEYVESYPDYGTGRVVCRFTATLSTSNIISGKSINQFAICDSSDPDDLNTTYYCASTFPEIKKDNNIEISFTIDLGI